MFSVAPWEVESDACEVVGFDSPEWNGEEWELALVDCGDRFNHTVLFRRSGGPFLRLTWTIPFQKESRAVEPDAMRRTFIECQNKGRSERDLFLDGAFSLRGEGEKAAHRIILHPEGEGYLLTLDDRRSYPGIFKWEPPTGAWLTEATANEVMSSLEENADFQYARRFLSMSYKERWREVWTWKRGNQRELKQVLTWALLAQEDLWQQETNIRLDVDLFHLDRNSGVMLYSDQFAVQSAENPRPLPTALAQGINKALEWFGPTMNTPHIEAHLSLGQLLDEGPWVLFMEPKDPTAHERLEAALSWREWLAQTGKP